MAYRRVVLGVDNDIFDDLVASYLGDEEVVDKVCGDVNALLFAIRVRSRERRSDVVFCSRRGCRAALELVICMVEKLIS